MTQQDWFSATKDTVWYVGGQIKYYITAPLRLFSGLPDWVKVIIYTALLLLAAFIAWKIYQHRDKWRYISPE
jgi:hypothetical protein